MVRSSQKRAHRRALDRNGRNVTVTQFSEGSENAYGDASISGDGGTTVTARVDRPSSDAAISRDAAGEEHEIDVRIFVKDSVTVSDTAPATRFTVAGTEYEVIVADDQDNGLIRAECRRV